MKFKIEIVPIEGTRPWEWRVWIADDNKDFAIDPFVTGSKKSVQLAGDEAMITIGLCT